MRVLLTLLIGLLTLAAAPAAQAQIRLGGEAYDANVPVMTWRDIPFRTVVRQEHDFSCGSAALATLMTYHYQRPVTEEAAFQAMYAAGDQTKIQQVGFSMLDMKSYLDKMGVKADGYRMTLDELAAEGEPAIALVNLGAYRHFVVVKGIDANRVLVGDPAAGLTIYSRTDFIQIWNAGDAKNGGIVFMLDDPVVKPVAFNNPSEWTPWSTAPINSYGRGDAVDMLTRDLTPLYQITPITDLASMVAG